MAKINKTTEELETSVETTQAMADYIVEQGTVDIWTYEKWASGKVVCYGKTTTSATSDPSGIYFVKCTLPFEFANTDFVVVCSAYKNTGAGANVYRYYTTSTTTFWVGSNLASTRVEMVVFGKWQD